MLLTMFYRFSRILEALGNFKKYLDTSKILVEVSGNFWELYSSLWMSLTL